MKVTVQYFDGCPHWRTALLRVHEALKSVDHEVTVGTHEVSSQREAERVGFTGSPTIMVDGRDPFDRGDDGAGLKCRLYETPDGVEGAPSVAQILAALEASG